jgi:hypothetical protein
MEIPEHLQAEIETLVRSRCIVPRQHIVRIWIDIENPDDLQKPSRDARLAAKLRGEVLERTANILEDHGIYFVGQVCRLQRSYVQGRMPKVGPKIFRELELLLHGRSLEFGYTGAEGPFERAALASIGK